MLCSYLTLYGMQVILPGDLHLAYRRGLKQA